MKEVGPYLSERQWGTVREDYSRDGNAWNYFSHDQTRSRAYHWGEDGLTGICDDKQRLCFALALWNERDPILKERLCGLTNSEGSHGEDVKEYYFYIDSTPTHSYMKYLYKYPQREYPCLDLVETNRRRSRDELEYELLDTGVFNDDRYFDVFVEYAKARPENVLIQITVHNRGPEVARLRVLPTLWFRNTWSWGVDDRKPLLRAEGPGVIRVAHHELGDYRLYCDDDPELLFTENETNTQRLWGQPNGFAYAMDRIGGQQHDRMWDEQDGFFYDVLRLPDGSATRLKVRSMVGLLPLCASTIFEVDAATRYPKLRELVALFKQRHPEVVGQLAPTESGFIGCGGRRLFSILTKAKLERVLGYLLDENEFLGPYGIRSLSRYHLDHLFTLWVGGREYKVQYLPAESNMGMFGGNSNWRGPVWMPVNALLLRALLSQYAFLRR
jgi:hypothetical protein